MMSRGGRLPCGALKATRPGAMGGAGCHDLPSPSESVKYMGWRRVRRVRLVFRGDFPGVGEILGF